MTSALFTPVAARFLWKEYRTLRGFWLAAFVIAAVLQALGFAFSPPNSDPVTPIFGIALAAAALYAVGVAATSFSMEHEEETYGFLTSLPARWMPLVAGKLSFAATSAVALAIALQLTGFTIAGMHTPSRGDYLELLATFGFAIVELLAWGTLFSLLLRQPLLAALLAIGAESLALTWAVNAFSEGNMPAMVLSSYAAVLPVRLAIAACVTIVSVLVARRWLVLDRPSGQVNAEAAIYPDTSPSTIGESLRAILTTFRRLVRRPPSPAFSHLLWQAWRQAWKPMLLMSVLVPLVCFCLVLISGLGRLAERWRDNQIAFMPFAFALFAMALYWSIVFQVDQRNQKYRLLAEHAVWPRYVWLTRIFVWSLPMVFVLAIAAGLTVSGIYDVLGHWRRHIEWMYRQQYGWHDVRLMAEHWRSFDYITRGVLFGLWGMLLGFAVGQATSLFFRRALVAGFAALVITLPLLVWGVAVWNWELAPTEFLLPIVLGLVAASWLRAPDWLLDRHRAVAWLIVLAALALPLAFTAWRLPAARAIPDGIQRQAVWQIQESIGSRFKEPIDRQMPFDAGQVVAEWVDRSNAQITKEQRAVGDQIVRLSEMVEYPTQEEAPVALNERLLKVWNRREAIRLNQTKIDEAVELGKKDFWFEVSDASFNRVDDLAYLLRDAGRATMLDGNLDKSLDYYLASLTIWERLWSSRSTATYPPPDTRQKLHASLVDWANAKGQTKARIQRLIAELDTIYPPVTELQPAVQSIDSLSSWTPPPQIVATYESLRNILLGKEPSHLLGKEARPEDYAAVIANELPFERERSLRILDLLTINEVAQWRDVLWRTNQQLLQDWAKNTIKARGEGGIENMGQALQSKIQRGYSLSFGYDDNFSVVHDYPPYSWLRTTALLRLELEHRRSFGDWLASIVDKQISAGGLRQQLALIAYQRDHGDYPQELAALVPDYMPSVPIDPYAGRPFEYRPEGVPLWFQDYRDSRRMEPNTPFLFSVGPRNEHLEIIFTSEIVDPATEVADYDVRQEIYVLQGRTPNWPVARPLVFALPKAPAAQVNSDEPNP